MSPLRSAVRIGGVAALAVGLGCATPRTPAGAPAARSSAEPAFCGALAPLVDLARAVTTSPAPPSSPLHALVDAQEELDRARAAGAGLAGATTELGATVEDLSELLETRVSTLGRATRSARDSYLEAESALREATRCRGLDVGALSARRAKPDELAIARSKACEPTVRLAAAVAGVDLASPISTSAVAGQITDLSLDADRARARDRLAAALRVHAERLRARDVPVPEPLAAARERLSSQVAEAYRVCVARAHGPPGGRSEGAPADPRRATVMVRPTWSGALATLGWTGGGFGSGFVVRWERVDGRVETFVLTNRHVIDGASEAEVLFSDEVDSGASGGRASKARRARLLASDESDDVAILRVDPPAGAAALVLRTEPPREQEVVVAAGFPGVGARPSFQVTRGAVSNAHFGAEERDVGVAYLQHTAPIDPGNSGGPLLDERGLLVGMNTAKLVGRENVSLAIPASRIRFALRRAEAPPRPGVLAAEASCNLALDALSADPPPLASVRRFGLAPFEAWEARRDGEAVVHGHGDRVLGELAGPLDEARVRAYEIVRAVVERERGVAPFETCGRVAADGEGFVATFTARSGATFRASLRVERGVVRLERVERVGP